MRWDKEWSGRQDATQLKPPEGFRVTGRGGGWWYLEWNPVPGAIGYDEEHEFSEGVRRTEGTRGGVFAVPPGDERSARVRAVGAGGVVSRWMKCTVNSEGRLCVDGEHQPEPSPPGPPPTPVFTTVTGTHGSVTAAWNQSPVALSWDARLLDSDSEPEQTVAVHAPENIFYGLEPDTRYGVQVRAVGSMGESAWSETRWVRTLQDDGHEAPQRPETLAAHCITDTSAQVTWDNDPHVEHWTISVNGQAETTYNNGKRLTDLTPDTGYTVTVTAHQGDADSAAAQVRFTTLPEENDPETALPAPHDVIVRALSPTEIELTWKQNGAVSTWFASVEADWQERVDLRRHSMRALFGGLTPGATYTAEVYGQQGWDLSPVARQAVTLPERI